MIELFDLKKRFFLVTGAAGLLGEQHCEAILASNGVPIAIDLDQEGLKRLKANLKTKYKQEIYTFKCSIINQKELLNVKNILNSKNIKLTGIINNAAINPSFEKGAINEGSRLENYDLKKWDLELEVGLKGSFLVIKVFSEDLLSHKHKGIIVNISSDLGIIAPDQRIYELEGLEKSHQPVKPITYSVIKSGLIGMTKYLATYFDGKVRANVLCPGGIQTNQDIKFVKKLSSLIPLKRMAKPNEYCGTIIYLLSDASSYMNGSVISVDGGRTVW